jgi:tRNA-dihydrouridine synthase A
VVRALRPYVERQFERRVPVRSIARHILGLYLGQPGGRRFRQILSDATRLREAGPDVLEEALAAVEPFADAA